MKNSNMPVILISSSSDLKHARSKIGEKLRQSLSDLSLQINPYLWEDETEDGRKIEPGTPIQKQINAMLSDRVEMTIVMLGERIGEPLVGDAIEGTDELLKAWQPHGLCHPWPKDAAERWAALEKGCFPLTGTVYELLVALSLNKRDVAPDEVEEHKGLSLKIGYVADKPIEAGTTRDEITLNSGNWFSSAGTAPPSSAKYSQWKTEIYDQQVQGVLNLVKALTDSPHASFIPWFENEEAMVTSLSSHAVKSLQDAYPTKAFEAVFKSDLSLFEVDDPMPFPDRKNLRRELIEQLKADGPRGYILTLRGGSGCGKSSLLRKGILGAEDPVRRDGISIALRPTDITARPEATPFLQFLSALTQRLEAYGITAPGLRTPKGNKISDEVDYAVESLENALIQDNSNLILGVDQFEEVIDYAALDSTDNTRGKPKSWWRILDFLGRAAHRDRIWIVATLESQRRDRVEELKLEERTGIHLSYMSVNFEVSEVAKFVREISSRRGLPLSPRVADAIEKMVDDYEKVRKANVGGAPNSSFLPLLSLWLHRLFDKFRDRKQGSKKGATGAFERTADLIELNDLEQRGINLKLDLLISELVEDAWREAGELNDNQVLVENSSVFQSFLSEIANKFRDGEALINSCLDERGFDLGKFANILASGGITQIPGINLQASSVKSPNNLENFFSGLVSVDDEGNMRLTDMPKENDTSSVERLIKTHIKRRLLEPIVATNNVRLVHQSVIDHWPPARQWYNAQKSQLISARKVKLAAFEIDENADYETIAQNSTLVANASKLLRMKRAIWTVSQVHNLSDTEQKVRSFCIDLLAAAPDGRLEYDVGQGKKSYIAFEAARYDLKDTLTRFLNQHPELLDFEDPNKNTLLTVAAWAAPKSVKLLLKRGAKIHGTDVWHPIAGAIQSGNIEGLRALLDHYDGPEQIIGPVGQTMLHEASRSPSSKSLEVLLEHTTDVNATSEDLTTPLHFSAHYGREKNLNLLLEANANPMARNANGMNILHFAAGSDNAEVVSAIRDHVTDNDRSVLLFGDTEDGDEWQSPIESAAYQANPETLKALLEWAGDDPIDRAGRHPLFAALASGAGKISQAQADRIGECVSELLNHGNIPIETLVRALRTCSSSLPDCRRKLENHLVLVAENLDDVDPATILNWVTGDRTRIAIEALRKRPDIINLMASDEVSYAHIILTKAKVEILLYCLEHELEPKENNELFRLEAAIRVCRNALPLPSIDQGAKASVMNLIFPGIDQDRIHPIISEVLSNSEAARSQTVLEMISDTHIRTSLHRLAMRGQLEIYTDIVDGLSGPLPQDAYGRLPSAVAPSSMRSDFEALEPTQPTSGVH